MEKQPDWPAEAAATNQEVDWDQSVMAPATDRQRPAHHAQAHQPMAKETAHQLARLEEMLQMGQGLAAEQTPTVPETVDAAPASQGAFPHLRPA